MVAPKTPRFWIEFTLRRASGPSLPEDKFYWAHQPIAQSFFVKGQVPEDGWGTVRRASSNFNGDLDLGNFSFVIDDSEGEFRKLMDDPEREYFDDCETALKLLSTVGIELGLEPRTCYRGLTVNPTPTEDRFFSFVLVPKLGHRLSPLSMDQLVPGDVISTREHLDCPKENVGKPYRILLGEKTNKGEKDANGEPIGFGMCPVDFLGYQSISSTVGATDPTIRPTFLPAPITASVTVVGATGTTTMSYAASAILADGSETARSNIVTVNNSIPEPDHDVSNYNRVIIVPPPGWEEIYKEQVVAVRIWGRDNPEASWLDGHSTTDFSLAIPEWQYNDGEIHDRDEHDVEKAGSDISVGTAIVQVPVPGEPASTTMQGWGKLGGYLGAIKINQIFGSSAAIGIDVENPRSIELPLNHPDLLVPGQPGYPGDNYVELGDPAIRQTIIYARGIILDHHMKNIVGVSFNGCGHHEDAAGIGRVIDQAFPALFHILDRLVASKYRSGAWPDPATWENGVSIVNEDAITESQDLTKLFLGTDKGYLISWLIDEQITVREVLRRFCSNFFCHVTDTQHGQILPFMLHDRFNLGELNHYKEHASQLTIKKLGNTDRQYAVIENERDFQFDYNHAMGYYRQPIQTVRNLDSISKRGLKKPSSPIDGICVADVATMHNVMGRRISFLSRPPFFQPMVTDLAGLENENGTFYLMTHPDYIGDGGAVERPFITMIGELDPDIEEVTLTGMDMKWFIDTVSGPIGSNTISIGLPGAAVPMGDRTIPLGQPGAAPRMG